MMAPMYSISDQPPAFDVLNIRSRQLLLELFSKLTVRGSERQLEAQKELWAEPSSRDKMYRVKEGVLTCRSQGRTILVYEPGDLVGLFSWTQPELLSLSTDFAVMADEYDRKDFENAVWANVGAARLWSEYLSCQFNLLMVMIGTLSPREVDFAPAVRSVAKGDVVIRQGDNTAEVFTLIEGALDVSVDGVRVGEVLRDEIFGALAAAADTARTATVTAREQSVVLSVPRDQFLSMIQSRPTTTLKLVQDMARTIVSLNKKVVSLS